MTRTKRLLGIALMSLLLALAVACVRVTATPTPTFSPVPTPTSTPTPQPSPTSTPSPTPTPTPAESVFITIDSIGDVGKFPSIVISPDGLPIIAYVDDTNNVIKVAKCGDPFCSESTLTTVDTFSDIPRSLSMALGSDGLPVIVYVDFDTSRTPTGADLKVLKCADLSCSDRTVSVLGSGQQPSIAVGPDGLPVVAYADLTSGDLKVVKCGDPACSAGNTVSTVDGAFVGNTSIAIGSDGLPVIAYWKRGEELKVAKCETSSCSRDNIISTVTSPSRAFIASISIAIGSDGLPVITYAEHTETTEIKVVKCGDLACSSDNAVTLLGSAGEGLFLSVVIGPDGLPVVVYNDSGDLKMTKCGTPSCSGDNIVTTVDRVSGSSSASVAFGPDELPIIAYYGNSDLKVVRCGDPACATVSAKVEMPPSPERWIVTTVGSGDVYLIGSNPSMLIGPDGLPVIAYTAETGERDPREIEQPLFGPKLILCADPSCSKRTSVELGVGGFELEHILAMGPDGFPVIVYHVFNEETDFEDLRVVKCLDPLCSERVVNTVDSTYFWTPPSIVVPSDGLPVLAYQDLMDFHLRVVKCGDPSCSADNIVTIVEGLADPDGTRWFLNSNTIAIPPDGLPVIAAYAGNGDLKVVKCEDPSCSESVVSIVDSGGLDTDTSIMTIGSDGLPVIAYYADAHLKVTKCENPSCSENTLTTVDSALADFIASVTPSIAIGSDGLPVIAYWTPNRDVKLAKCANPACTESNLAVVGRASSFALAIGPDGLPLIVYYKRVEAEDPNAPVDLRMAKCLDLSCMSE